MKNKFKTFFSYLILAISIIALIAFVVFAYNDIKNDKSNTNNDGNLSEGIDENKDENIDTTIEEALETDAETQIETEPETTRVESVKIKAVGDILYHKPLIRHAKNMAKEDEDYNFDDQYEKISDFLSDADITIGNFEGTYNPNKEFNGYPMFNAPKELFTTLKNAGFDILATMNNHTLDTGIDGLESTIDGIRETGMMSFGTQKNLDEKYQFMDVNDIKIAFLSYGDSLNGLDFYVESEENANKINRLDPVTIKEDIEKVKEMGSDIVIIYPHWGVEYVEMNSQEYISLARDMIGWGADAVLGGHPHVVLQEELHETPDGRVGYIIHSMGNFISNQVRETLNNSRVEHGVVVELEFEKNFNEDEVKLIFNKTHPTWLKRTADGTGEYLHQPVLAEEYVNDESKLAELNNDQRERVTKAYNMTNEKLAEPLE